MEGKYKKCIFIFSYTYTKTKHKRIDIRRKPLSCAELPAFAIIKKTT